MLKMNNITKTFNSMSYLSSEVIRHFKRNWNNHYAKQAQQTIHF